MRYVPAAHHGPTRATASINLIVLHSTEGLETSNSAEGTAAMFANPDSRVASAHVVVDNDSEICCVPDNVVAYGAPGANSTGLHLEQAGTAAQTAAQWTDPYSTCVGLRAAAQIARWCTAYPHLTPTFLDHTALLAGRRNGVTTHLEVNRAWPSTGHTDPGENYPLSSVLTVANAILHPTGNIPVLNPSPAVDFRALRIALANAYAGTWPSQPDTHPNDRSIAVVRLQQVLNLVSGANLIEDGQYGVTTTTAVANYQRLWNLNPGTILDPSGTCGPYTRVYLLKSLQDVAAGK
jgi:hypothetical protein